jgi:hypothetical protein
MVGISPDRTRIIAAGEATWDLSRPFGVAAPPRAWLTMMTQDGVVTADLSPFSGYFEDIAIDDAGRGYALQMYVEDPDDPDESPTPCLLLAFEPDGTERWTTEWDIQGGARMPDELITVADRIIVRTQTDLVAYTPGGDVAWLSEIPHPADFSVVDGDTIWFAGTRDSAPTPDYDAASYFVRCTADGSCGEATIMGIAGLRLGAVDIASSGVVALQCEGPMQDGSCRLAVYDHDGEEIWHVAVEAGGALASGPDGHWVIGSTYAADHDETGAIANDRHHMWLRHHREGGAVDLRTHRTFVEDRQDAIDRSDCPTSDVEYHDVVGSRAETALRLASGNLLISGRQGCRDGFLLALGVSP